MFSAHHDKEDRNSSPKGDPVVSSDIRNQGTSTTRKRAAPLKTSQDGNNQSEQSPLRVEDVSPDAKMKCIDSGIKRRSPKRIIVEEPIEDVNIPGFPALSLIDPAESDSPHHAHLRVLSVSTATEGMTELECVFLRADDENTENVDENGQGSMECTVYLQGMWHACEVTTGSTIRIIGAKRWDKNAWLVNDEHGLLIVRSDCLVSCTSVVQSFFCPRKAVLAERVKGGNASNKAMLTGIIIHELFQAALIAPSSVTLTSEWLLGKWRETIMDEVLVSLTALNYTPEQFERELEPYVEVIIDWVRQKMPGRLATPSAPLKTGDIVREVHDIEENVWLPLLGLKGKIDVSLKVRESGALRSEQLLPLELKTGKSAHSADHAGQVLMYLMMLSHRYKTPIQKGALLYLKDGTERPVEARAGELRGILARRNEVAVFSGDRDARLPPPRADTRFCERCEMASVCTLFGRTFEEKRSEAVALRSDEAYAFQLQATEHLEQQHIEYFERWIRWINMEQEKGKERQGGNVSDIWMVPAYLREKRRNQSCMANLRVSSCEKCDGRYRVIFEKSCPGAIPFTPGDIVIVSSDRTPAIVMAPVVSVEGTVSGGSGGQGGGGSVTIMSDRELPPRNSNERIFHLDRHESAAISGIHLLNVVSLLGDDERSSRLRELLIDLREPRTVKMSSKDVKTIKPLMALMNQGQVSAVVKVLCAGEYALIEGLPGSGKTTTLVCLVRAMASLGRSVLLTAYTHSAVDTLLAKLAKHMDASQLLRLGRESSVHPSVRHLTLEQKLLEKSQPSPRQKYDTAKHILATTPVVACTSLSVASHTLFSWRRFALCVVDESSLVLECSLLAALQSSEHFVLVGDAKQLAPLVQSKKAKEEGMAVSLFERLLQSHRGKHAVALEKQFRMNRVLSALSSSLFYDGRLVCANTKVAEACLYTEHDGYEERRGQRRCVTPTPHWLALSGSLEESAVFVDTRRAVDGGGDEGREENGQTKSLLAGEEEVESAEPTFTGSTAITNQKEAETIGALVRELVECGISPCDIGVMCIYRRQVDVVKEAVAEGVEVNTVDQWQGRDKSIVFCSLTWTLAHGRKRSDLLLDERRINVALTRAKHKLIFVGCGRSMRERCPLIAQVIERCKRVLL